MTGSNKSSSSVGGGGQQISRARTERCLVTDASSIAYATAAIRHAIQDHAGAHFKLGDPANIEDVVWLASLLGWSLPRDYLALIAVHDGVDAGGDIIFNVDQCFATLRVYRQEWHHEDGYWPVAGDGCGNYWVMSVSDSPHHPAGTIFFFDHESDLPDERLVNVESPNYPAFVIRMMSRVCASANCHWSPA